MRASSVAVGLLVLAACSSTSAPKVLPPTTVVRTAACATPTPFGAGDTPNEVRVRTTRGEAWGLALEGDLPPRPGERVKIVWRVTGRGPLQVTLTDPAGRAHQLAFGPEPHASSTYRRPGDEWGTGFRFTTRGCWRIHLSREGTAGHVWIEV